jgi:hypothetical protein
MASIMTWVPQVLSVNGGKVPVDVNALIREVHRTVGEATNVRVVPSAKGGLNIYFEGVTYRHAEFREKINFMDRHREHNLLKTGPYIMADFMDAFKVRFVVASEPKSPISIYIPQKGSVVVLASRAALVNFPELLAAAASGHIRAGIDVWPEEPVPRDEPGRSTPNTLIQAHRAGSVPEIQPLIGQLVVDDLENILADLPPQRCQRAVVETVAKLRSIPVGAWSLSDPRRP